MDTILSHLHLLLLSVDILRIICCIFVKDSISVGVFVQSLTCLSITPDC